MQVYEINSRQFDRIQKIARALDVMSKSLLHLDADTSIKVIPSMNRRLKPLLYKQSRPAPTDSS